MHMKKNTSRRCPWCGKRVFDGASVLKKVTIILSPVRYCPECSNYLTTYYSTAFYGMLLSAACYLYIGKKLIILYGMLIVAAIVYAVSIVIAFLGKYKWHRFASDGKRNKFSFSNCSFIGTCENKNCKKSIALTEKTFDERAAFSVSSPINITKYSKKTGKIEFVFLYDHPDNGLLVENSGFEAYIQSEEKYNSIRIENITIKK